MTEQPKQPKTNKKPIEKLVLNNLKSVKKSIGRVTNAILHCDADEIQKYRTLVYSLNCLVTAYKVSDEERLQAIEDHIQQEKKNG